MSDFWNKRKAAVEAEAEAEQVEADQEALEQASAEQTDAEILDALGLPDPDSMKQGDDFSAYMSDVVPARLKTRALRKLWRLNPILANVDGLVDYGEDFTDASMVIENMQTTYQVGKGMLAHVQELARQALEKEEAKAALSETQETEDLHLSTDPETTEPEPETHPQGEAQPMATLDVAEPEGVAPRDDIAPNSPRRRMQFHFEDQHTA